MRDLPLIDRAHLTAQTFGDADLAREVLGLFVDQCRRLTPMIGATTLLAAERADLAHTLKGARRRRGRAGGNGRRGGRGQPARRRRGPRPAGAEAAVAATLAQIAEDGAASDPSRGT